MSPWASGDSLNSNNLNNKVGWGSAFLNAAAGPYSADTSGTGNSTASIQAALNAVAALGGGTVLLPHGKYRIDSFLTIGPNTRLLGESSLGTIYTNYGYSQLSGTSSATSSMLRSDYNTANSYNQSLRNRGITIERMSLAGPSAGTGVDLNFGAWNEIRDCHILGFTTGLGLSAMWDSDVQNLIVTNCATGVLIQSGDTDNTNNIHLRHLHVETSSKNAVVLSGTGSHDVNHIYFYGAKLEGVGGASADANVKLSDTRFVNFYGGHCDVTGTDSVQSRQAFVRLDGDARWTNFFGMTFANNAIAAPLQSVVRCTNTAGNNEGLGLFGTILEVRGTSLSSGVLNVESGTLTNAHLQFSDYTVGGSGSSLLAGTAPTGFFAMDDQNRIMTRPTFQAEPSVNAETAIILSGYTASDLYYLGRLQASGTTQTAFRFMHGENVIWQVVPSTDDIQFRTGNVAVGTQVPTEQLHLSGATVRIATSSASIAGNASGNTGDMMWGPASGVTYLYVCTSGNSWARAALNPF